MENTFSDILRHDLARFRICKVPGRNLNQHQLCEGFKIVEIYGCELCRYVDALETQTIQQSRVGLSTEIVLFLARVSELHTRKLKSIYLA